MRWPQRIMSLLSLTLLLVVPPWVLVRLVGWPLPTTWPTAGQTRQWLAQPLTEDTVTVALTVGAWLVWALLAGTALHRTLVRLRVGVRWLRRMPVPTPMQATASGMAGAAVFGFTTSQVATPAVAAPLPATADAPHPNGLEHPAGPDDEAQPAGVTLPGGGWIPQATAVQISVLAALLWLRRRRDYRPGQPASGGDLTSLPATVSAVQAATGAPAGVALPDVTATAGGQHTHGGLLSANGLPAEGVSLAGPGSADAARGLLVTLLLPGPDRPLDGLRLVTTRALLAELLGPAAAPVATMDALHVADTVEEAVAVLDATLTHRNGPARTSSSRPGGADDHIPLVLLTTAVSPDTATRLAAVLAAANGTATAVVLDAWPHGITWQVDTTGHTHQPDRARGRLCVLGQVAATDLLTVITHAQPNLRQPDPQPICTPDLTGRTEIPSPPRVPRQASADRSPAPHPTRTDRQHPVPHLRILGEPTLTHNGTPVAVRRSAALQALVYLAVHHEGADSRNLIAAIWPGLPAHPVTGRLYTTISDLRKTLQAASGQPTVERAGDRYRLNPDHLDVDLWRLQAAAHHASTTLTGPDRTTAWRTVIDTYTGDLAAGHDWPWLAGPREAARRHLIDAYAALADTHPGDAVALLQDAIRVDPYNEDLHRRAMRALAAIGDHPAVDMLLDTYTRRLAAAGLQPHSELRPQAAGVHR